jgi:hypothetical protein
MNVKIEKGIPITPKKGGSRVVETMRAMEIGDSVLVPITARSCWLATAHRLSDRKYISRAVEGGVRIWRVE